MKKEDLNRGWSFQKGSPMLMMALATGSFGRKVNLPHDYMIESDVRADAPAGAAMGYYTEGVATYTKELDIPAEWEGEKIYLHFDGVMMNAAIAVNGSLLGRHHYGYTPFTVDLTDALYYGEKNRISVTVNPSMQPNSRWYSGAGIFRHVSISHAHPLHIAPDGIFAWTKRLEEPDARGDFAKEAMVLAEVTVCNDTDKDHQVRVKAELAPEETADSAGKDAADGCVRDTVLLVKAHQKAVARIPMTVKNPVLWNADHTFLYQVKAQLFDMGTFGVSLNPAQGEPLCDEADTWTGIRTVTADSTHGLRVNGRSLKLKGGCIHHDNGLLGAVSLYDSEYRKLKLLKGAGFNAVRLAHNPPSRELLEACDRIGLYVFDEAFDAWGFSKQAGDYSQFFEDHWKEDMEAFIIRDRNHPSVLFWSTGNEVEERGGMGNGYAIAEKLAAYVRTLDSSRLVTNGLCSMWSGLDDKEMVASMMRMRASMEGNMQNVDLSKGDSFWEDRTEAFCNCLDVVGYNYMDSHYAISGERYPERVILGTESYPNQIDKVWELVEKYPYVIGDCTWTAFDYIGEAGIGKSGFFEKDDPTLKMGAYALSSHGSQFPWRLANDADFTISGRLTPQGVYRKIVWGGDETGVFVQDPKNFGQVELVSMWGWNQMSDSWNYPGYEGKPVKVYVYSAAPEVELFLNGVSQGRKNAGKENRYTAVFEIAYEKGELRAVSIGEDQREISEAKIVSTGRPAAVRLVPEKTALSSDGESLAYVAVELVDDQGNVVPDAEISLTAEVTVCADGDSAETDCREGAEDAPAYLAGFGSDNPITEDNYTSGTCVSWQGRAMAIVRSGFAAGRVTLAVRGENLAGDAKEITVG